ncbi:hypothetical protein BV20DRAFT_429991 [Pilatotrama ljubarskyi]|nr:hypothetical protein BV20DRAFT_429991 [Pilatotrama ljubarskyi]
MHTPITRTPQQVRLLLHRLCASAFVQSRARLGPEKGALSQAAHSWPTLYYAPKYAAVPLGRPTQSLQGLGKPEVCRQPQDYTIQPLIRAHDMKIRHRAPAQQQGPRRSGRRVSRMWCACPAWRPRLSCERLFSYSGSGDHDDGNLTLNDTVQGSLTRLG